MHTNRVLSSSPSSTPARRGRWIDGLVLAAGLLGSASFAQADEFHTVLGAGIGAITGAVIGQSIGGRNGAIVGAGAGGLVGASMVHYDAPPPRHVLVQPVVTGYPYQRGFEPGYAVRPPVAAWQPPPPRHPGNWREPHGYGHPDSRGPQVIYRYERIYVEPGRYAPPQRDYGYNRDERYDRHRRHDY
jgi:hypothetical protein